MRASGPDVGATGLEEGTPVTLDSIADFARQIGFNQRLQLNFPKGNTGDWTLSRDSQSNHSADPTTDRTALIDQYGGKIPADVRFADYSFYGKGIALHEGDMGWQNILLNTLFCLSFIFVSLSGAVNCWLRRPSKAGVLAAPALPRDLPLWKGMFWSGLPSHRLSP